MEFMTMTPTVDLTDPSVAAVLPGTDTWRHGFEESSISGREGSDSRLATAALPTGDSRPVPSINPSEFREFAREIPV